MLESLPNCPVCGSHRHKSLSRPRVIIGEEHFGQYLNGMGLSLCLDCGLEYVNPRPSSALLEDYYARPGYSAHSYEHPEMAEEVFRKRVDYVNRLCLPGELVDVGCGGGGFLAAARNAGWSVQGVELSERGRESVLRRNIPVYERINAVRAKADVVTMYHVLEHVSDLKNALNDVKTILKPSGICVIEVPNVCSIRARLIGAGLKPSDDDRYRAFPIHLYGFQRRSLCALLEANGYKVVECLTHGLALYGLLNKQTVPECRNATDNNKAAGKINNGLRFKMISAVSSVVNGMRMGENLVVVARVE